MSAVATAIIGGAIIGGVASNMAASKQAEGAQAGVNAQEGMFNTIRGQEQPFTQAGQAAQGQLNYLTGSGTPGQGGEPTSSTGGGYGSLLSPFTMDTFHNMSPGYNFALEQGKQGVLSGDAAGAGALSGSAQKDLMGFNSGLANQWYNNAFQQYQTQQGNIYSRLAGISQLGQAAGSNQASGGSNFGSSIGQQLYNVGSAQAGGIVGSANALGGAAALPWLMQGAGSASRTPIINDPLTQSGGSGTNPWTG